MTVSGMHSFLMDRDDVIAATSQFLNTGALRADGERQPIPRPTAAASDVVRARIATE